MSWRLTVAGSPPLHDWDGEVVVYNRLSGDTHVLDIVTAEVLRSVVAATCMDEEALCRRVAAFLDVDNNAAVRERVDRIVRALDSIGLIEPAAGC